MAKLVGKIFRFAIICAILVCLSAVVSKTSVRFIANAIGSVNKIRVKMETKGHGSDRGCHNGAERAVMVEKYFNARVKSLEKDTTLSDFEKNNKVLTMTMNYIEKLPCERGD